MPTPTIELDELTGRLRHLLPGELDYASARLVDERSRSIAVRDGVVQPVSTHLDTGVMITVWHEGGVGHAATSDLSDAGVRAAIDAARAWAARSARLAAGLGLPEQTPLGHPVGSYESPVARPADTLALDEWIALLVDHERRLGGDPRIVDTLAAVRLVDIDSVLVTNGGGHVHQRFHHLFPVLQVTANEGTNTQTRSYGGGSYSGQGGIEVLDRHGFGDAAPRLREQVLELLSAPNCPSGRMHVVLAPDQMILQIHESIGHPLELDRILGDERNYAGTSFVTPDMFGTYRYGSELLNVTYDPTVPGQLASYAFDDDGTPAERTYLIRRGILERPLGGAVSQARAGLPGVANARACSWNRAPIDRMANLNVEPGTSTLDELVAGVERGVWLETNNSWSIDDSRNKFQFGCEYGRIIVDGELGPVVRNPGYRGISATFWRSLDGVGDADTFAVMGVPNCGKGEPNQMQWVGHASPVCRFADVEVFGGEA
ncbi:MAG: TldD/PmbA family protein [Actinomyces sp.]|nr:MAG: TldD/PmbA family protein [Actinomyces sp.]